MTKEKNAIQPLRSEAYHQINRLAEKKAKKKNFQRPIYWLKYVFCLSYHCVTYVKYIISKIKNTSKKLQTDKKKKNK